MEGQVEDGQVFTFSVHYADILEPHTKINGDVPTVVVDQRQVKIGKADINANTQYEITATNDDDIIEAPTDDSISSPGDIKRDKAIADNSDVFKDQTGNGTGDRPTTTNLDDTIHASFGDVITANTGIGTTRNVDDKYRAEKSDGTYTIASISRNSSDVVQIIVSNKTDRTANYVSLPINQYSEYNGSVVDYNDSDDEELKQIQDGYMPVQNGFIPNMELHVPGRKKEFYYHNGNLLTAHRSALEAMPSRQKNKHFLKVNANRFSGISPKVSAQPPAPSRGIDRVHMNKYLPQYHMPRRKPSKHSMPNGLSRGQTPNGISHAQMPNGLPRTQMRRGLPITQTSLMFQHWAAQNHATPARQKHTSERSYLIALIVVVIVMATGAICIPVLWELSQSTSDKTNTLLQTANHTTDVPYTANQDTTSYDSDQSDSTVLPNYPMRGSDIAGYVDQSNISISLNEPMTGPDYTQSLRTTVNPNSIIENSHQLSDAELINTNNLTTTISSKGIT